ncbi:MAG: 50S ribosomal protein L11 methyltransferase, partial [Desulfobulbales bacterium]
MELEITIEAANPLKHDLLAALAGLIPRQRITVVGTETDSNRIRLSFTVAARSPDILLQEIGAVVARFESASPGEEVLDIRVRNIACSEPPIDTIQPGGFFSPVAGLRILSGNSGADNPVPATEDILLEPSQAFGTGLHPSTKLCLSLLKQVAELDPQNQLAPY